MYIIYNFSSKPVSDDDSDAFKKSEMGPMLTNNINTKFSMTHLQPYTVYAFQIQAINEVGWSRPSKRSYPAITLMESK